MKLPEANAKHGHLIHSDDCFNLELKPKNTHLNLPTSITNHQCASPHIKHCPVLQ